MALSSCRNDYLGRNIKCLSGNCVARSVAFIVFSNVLTSQSFKDIK